MTTDDGALHHSGDCRATAGDRVWVDDPTLAALRRIVRQELGEEPPPNHHGTVDHVHDGLVYIIFDGEDGPATGACAPYPAVQVHLLLDQGERLG